MQSLEKLRHATLKPLVWGQFLHIPLLLAFGFGFSLESVLPDVLVSLILSVICVGFYVTMRDSAATRHLIATSYVLQASVLVMLFTGHAWQIDMHMYFFAVLAMITALFDWRSIIVAATVTAVHHLILNFTIPLWVFPGGGNLGRVLVHAVIVVAETAVLVVLSFKLQQMLNLADRISAEAVKKAEQATLATKKAAESEAYAKQSETKAREETERAKTAEESANAAVISARDEAEKARQAQKSAKDAHAKIERQTEMQNIVVEQLSRGLDALARCDLTVKIDQRFDDDHEGLRQNFNNATAMLNDLICSIELKASNIQTNLSELAQSASDLSTHTENQANQVAETSTHLEDISGKVVAADTAVQEAGRKVKQTEAGMESLNSAMGRASDAMMHIKGSSDQISKITDVIDGIAFQTNLLALNAGVEAARAGEAGRGFAVVAQEVRALALRSTEAANEIKTSIAQSEQNVQMGANLVTETGDSLSNLVQQVADFGSIFEDISLSSQEQAVALGNISHAVNNIGTITQSNKGRVENSTTATHCINSETHELIRLLKQFKAKPLNQQAFAA